MILSNLYLKHWIKFKYDTSKALTKIGPHYIFPIKDSIHYKALKFDNFDDYEQLIYSTDQKEHSLESFKTLLLNFDIRKIEKIKIRYNKNIGGFLVNDGCHRLAIILYKKIFKTIIPEEYLAYE